MLAKQNLRDALIDTFLNQQQQDIIDYVKTNKIPLKPEIVLMDFKYPESLIHAIHHTLSQTKPCDKLQAIELELTHSLLMCLFECCDDTPDPNWQFLYKDSTEAKSVIMTNLVQQAHNLATQHQALFRKLHGGHAQHFFYNYYIEDVDYLLALTAETVCMHFNKAYPSLKLHAESIIDLSFLQHPQIANDCL